MIHAEVYHVLGVLRVLLHSRMPMFVTWTLFSSVDCELWCVCYLYSSFIVREMFPQCLYKATVEYTWKHAWPITPIKRINLYGLLSTFVWSLNIDFHRNYAVKMTFTFKKFRKICVFICFSIISIQLLSSHALNKIKKRTEKIREK